MMTMNLINHKVLLDRSNTVTMKVKRMRALCIEIYRTLNSLSSKHMKELFKLNCPVYSPRRSQILHAPRVNQTTFGLKSIRYEGPKIWNHLSLSRAQITAKYSKTLLNRGLVQLVIAISASTLYQIKLK